MDSAIRHTWFDRVLPWLLGAGVAALAWFTGNSLELPPELWDEIAVAAKLRPPVHEFPLFWQRWLSPLIKWFGVSSVIAGMKLAGPISMGILSVLAFRFLEGCLPVVMRTNMCYSAWGRWIVRTILVQCTVMFVCSEPVWLAGRVLSPEMLSLLFSMLVLELAQKSIRGAGVASLVVLGGLSGLMAAETPLAVLPPLCCWLYLRMKAWDPANSDLPPLANPILCTVAVRRMAWCFILFFILAAAGNISFFTANCGGGETDAKMFIATAKYFLNYANVVSGATSPFGFFLIVAIVVLPLMIVAAKVKVLTDVGKFLPIPYACFLSLAGIVAYSQTTGFASCHFWRWTHNAVPSQYLLCLCMLGASIAVMLVLCVFAVDVYFRNYGRLLREMFPEAADDDDPLVWRVMRSFRLSVKVLRPLMRFEPFVAIALVLPFRFDGSVREMTSVVNEVARQTAAECGDVTMLFTDGSLDAAVEVIAKMNGHDLKALSMMSTSGKYDIAVRLRGETNEEGRVLLSVGAADALRTWVTTKNPCVSNIALQVGLELWRRNNLPMPEAGGLVSRTAGFPKGKAEIWARSARSLSERMLKLYEEGDPMNVCYPELKRLFLFGQWRLSRMCRMRANAADGRNDAESSEKENSLADRLDRFNPEWQKVQDRMDWIGKQHGMRLTPREGLKLGLERADFRLARSYARKVLAADENDVQANFALGMGYFTEKQYGRAEMHLKKCLVRAPGEPAVLNNLAIVQLRLGRYAEAETNAVRALERFPDSSEIKTTLRHIRAAMNERKETKK